MANTRTKIAVFSIIAILLVLVMTMSIATFTGNGDTTYTNNIGGGIVSNTAVNIGTDAPMEDGKVAEGYQPASGSEGVSSIEELRGKSGTYHLTTDFEVGGMNWYDDSTYSFSGVLDGCGHTITVNAEYWCQNWGDSSAVGLFSILNNATVKNLNIKVNKFIARIGDKTANVGMLAGKATGTVIVDNVNIVMNYGASTLSADDSNNTYISSWGERSDGMENVLGGVFGVTQGNVTISNTTVNNNTYGDTHGFATQSRVTKPLAGSDTTYTYVGMFVGRTYDGTLNMTNITLAGNDDAKITVYGTSTSGRNNNGYIGGLIGYNYRGTTNINGLVVSWKLKHSLMVHKNTDETAHTGILIGMLDTALGSYQNIFFTNGVDTTWIQGNNETNYNSPIMWFDKALNPRFDGNDNIAFYGATKIGYDDPTQIVSQVLVGNQTSNVLGQMLLKDGETPGSHYWVSVPKPGAVSGGVNLAATKANVYQLNAPVGMTTAENGDYVMSSTYNATIPQVVSNSTILNESTAGGTNAVYSQPSSANIGTYELIWDNESAGFAKHTYAGTDYYVKSEGGQEVLYTVASDFDITKPIKYTINPCDVTLGLDFDTNSIIYKESFEDIKAKLTLKVLAGNLYGEATSFDMTLALAEGGEYTTATPAGTSVVATLTSAVLSDGNSNYNITYAPGIATEVQKLTLTGAFAGLDNVVYTGTSQTPAVYSLDGYSDLTFAYEYFQNEVSMGANVLNAGDYKVVATCQDASIVLANPETTFNVAPYVLTITQSGVATTNEYNGESISDFAQFFNAVNGIGQDSETVFTLNYSVTNSAEVVNAILNADTYTITASLNDSTGNYTAQAKSIEYVVSPKEVNGTIELPANLEYDGQEKVVTYSAGELIGNDQMGIVYFIGEQAIGVTPVDAGTYTAKLTLPAYADGKYNYVWAEGAEQEKTFEITKKVVEIGINEDAIASKDYDGQQVTDFSGLFVAPQDVKGGNIALTITTEQEVVNAGEYTITASLNDSTGNYTASDVKATYTINQAQITGEFVAPENLEYDGTQKAYTFSSDNTVINYYQYNSESQAYDIELGETAPANAGSYKAVVSLVDSDNYVFAEETVTEVEFVITAKSVAVVWSNTELTYNGLAQAPTASAETGVEGESLELTVDGQNTNAGEGYTATASTNNGNYVLTNNTTTYSIAKAKATITAEAMSYAYGEEVASTGSAVVSGEVNGEKLEYSVAVEYAEEYVVGGDYDIVVTLTEGSEVNANYEITIENAKLTITKADNALSGELTIAGWTYGDEANAPSG